MQIVQFQVEDNKLDMFLRVINNLQDGLFKNVTIKNSDELDSNTLAYMKTSKFQKDKAYFQKCLEDFDNGKTIALSHNDVWEQIDNYTRVS